MNDPLIIEINHDFYEATTTTTLQEYNVRDDFEVEGLRQVIPHHGEYRLESNIGFTTTPSIVVEQALLDLNLLISDIRALPNGVVHDTSFDDGEVITPGVYNVTGATGVTGTQYFDAQGDPDAIFVIRVGGTGATLTFTAGNTQVLQNGAQSSNIWWLTDGALDAGASINLSSNIIMTAGGFIPGASMSLDGRLLSTGGAISLPGATFAKPTGISTLETYSMEDFVLYTGSSTISNSISGGVGDAGSGNGGTITLPGLIGNIWELEDSISQLVFSFTRNGVKIVNSSRTFEGFATLHIQTILSDVVDFESGENISVNLEARFGTARLDNRDIYIFRLQDK